MPDDMNRFAREICIQLAGERLSDRLGQTHDDRRAWMREYLASPRTSEELRDMLNWLQRLPEAPPEPVPTPRTMDLAALPGSGRLRQDGATQSRPAFTPSSAHPHDLDPGVYEVRDPADPQQIGKIYVVKWNKRRTGKYAMTVTHHYDADGKIKGSLEFDRTKRAGGLYEISPSDRMVKSRAVILSSMFGFCIRCGRTLSDPTSVERSMGPVCIKNI